MHRREKLAVARLQQEVARSESEGTMCEKLMHELEEERCLRLETERQLREVTLKSEIGTSQMQALHQQFTRMEETVRNLLQNQGALGQCSRATADLLDACQVKMSEEVTASEETAKDLTTAADEYSNREITIEDQEKTMHLLERLRTLEAENSALALENEHQRVQYERCLDEVANQVVQALLTQKDLREECLKLRTRVFDLEQQNRTLNVLFQQRVRLVSDSLLQKLHSRIVDLSSGDLFSNAEWNRHPIKSKSTDTQIQEAHPNTPSNVSVLKCQSQLNLTVPSQLYPRSSCSSELSISSACSEHSSGSCTWNERRTCSKRSSLNWETRLSIGSSLPSNLSSPVEEQPLTREKESHVLEGLKKLQKKKPFLEPPSIVSKWAYKDCMNSNEGIYSLGLRCRNRNKGKDPMSFKATRKTMCLEERKPLEYDSDSHDDPDDDCTAIINEVPSKDCKSFCKKLTHSISDSLFDWDHSVSENLTHLSSREKPEKLTSFVTSFQSSDKLCTGNKLPGTKLQFNSTKLHYKDLTIQLSDNEDIEILDELQLENTERNSPESPLSCHKKFFSSADKDEDHFSSCFDEDTRTSSLLKDNYQATKFVKTSSEECITIVFDAEDGQPIRFNSQQTASVTVSSNQISHPYVLDGNCQKTILEVEDAVLMPQGPIACQRGTDARNYKVSASFQGHMEQNPEVNEKTFCSVVQKDSVNSEKPLSQHNPQQQRILKPACKTAHKSNCTSSHSAPKPFPTKIPNRGKRSSQKPCNVTRRDAFDPPSTSDCPNQAKPPALPTTKFSKYLKMPNIRVNNGLKNDPNIPKCVPPLPQGLKIAIHNETGNNYSGTGQGSLFLRQPKTDRGDQPTRDKYDSLDLEEMKSLSTPPPPGRSTPFLFKPNCQPCLNLIAKSENPTSVDTVTPAHSSLNPLGITCAASPSSQLTKETQIRQNQKSPALADLSSLHQSELQNSAQLSRESKDFTKITFEAMSPKANCLKSSSSMFIEPCPQAAAKMIRGLTCNHANQKDFSHQNTFSAKTTLLCENDLTMPCNVLSTSSPCHLRSIIEPSAQAQHGQSPIISHDKQEIFSCFEERKPKTRIPIGLKGFLKSPPLLRKSSTVPGKHEKDSINSHSKENVIQRKSGQVDASESSKPLERPSSVVSCENRDDLHDVSVVKIGSPREIDSEIRRSRNTAGGNDVNNMEIKAFKRSISVNSKPYLKPALGMNGAKARSQSFSNQNGEKPSVSMVDGPGKVRTQIITNTTDRGNSLTRQNSANVAEAVQSKPTCVSSATQSPSHTPKTADISYVRQVSNGSISSSSSQHSSPSKLPCRTPSKGDSQISSLKCFDNQSPPQKETKSLPLSNRSTEQIPQNKKYRMQPGYECHSSPNMSSAENPQKSHSPSEFGAKVVKKQENLSKGPEITDRVQLIPPVSETHCSIEAKVMLGIQENMQKVQGREKVQAAETKQKSGPSIAKWFGFRKSKLPASNSKMSVDSKSKDEKKVTKNGTGIKQTKLDKKKDKRKNEKCERENDVTKQDTSYVRKLESDYPSKHSEFICQEGPYNRRISVASKYQGCKDYNIPTKESKNDHFMQELLHRVDKKASHQKENGSNRVSCRNMSQGNSHSSALPSNSNSVHANHGKDYKMKPPSEIQNEIHILSAKVEKCTNPESTKESTCQDQMIVSFLSQKHSAHQGSISGERKVGLTFQVYDFLSGSNCQMRTLDSGIGTFPLPDSANRATGRHLTKTTSCFDYELPCSLEKYPYTTNVSQKAKTLEREVPYSPECSSPQQDMIGHSASDPTMVVKSVQAFQSCLPKLSTAGVPVAEYKIPDSINQGYTSTQCSNICKSEHLKLSERVKNVQHPGSSQCLHAHEQAMHLCSYSASGSDNEREAGLGSTENGTGREEFFNQMKHSKNGSQQQYIDSYGNQSRVLTFYQPNLYMHYGKEIPVFSMKQLRGDLNKDEKVDDMLSEIKQVGKEGSNSKLPIPPNVSLDRLNRVNFRRMEEVKNCLPKSKADKESARKPEEVSLSSPERTGVDHSESLSDSLYDSFSSCASNDV
ncbi:nck-associated protein 5 isoform X2 [Narcine bancroftii]|uniref:nck-associated protein 5 isoform X2 n=1 Tax=Narcine bancroftii TaxID=1343680 RepID=UPI003831A8B4